jgi:hypothetical protein
MVALVVLLIALSGAAVYLVAGWRIAVRNLPRAWEHARSEWGGGFDSQMQRDLIRSSVRGQVVAMILFWPVILTYLALSARLDRAVDAGDPVRLKARIAELERELGIR